MKPSLYFLLFLLSAAGLNGQTCVIAKQTKDTIYLAADSRFSVIVSVGDTMRYRGCKITAHNKIYFANVGYSSQAESQKAIKAIDNSNSFDVFTKDFCNRFKTELEELVANIKTKTLSEYITYVRLHSPFLAQTVFCGFEHGHAKIYVVGFWINKSQSLWEAPKIDWGIGHDTAVARGDINEIATMFYDKKTYQKGIVNGILTMMDLEISAHKCNVGKPVDIIKITPSGVEEITPTRSCEFTLLRDCN